MQPPPTDRYGCEETFRRLDDYLDRELTAAEMALVREHLGVCEMCAREFRFEARIVDDVKDKVRRLSAPPELLERVARTLRSSQDPKS
jgi:anti-sigma factor (TIGR02949 family)